MKIFFRFLFAFLAVTGAVVLMSGLFHVRFGQNDFWNYHGMLFLVFIAFFPRLTLLLSSVPSGGLLWWAGWIFAPRLLVAFLATLTYWYQNPFLVIISWLVALGGESSEKYAVIRRSQTQWNGKKDPPKYVESEWK